MFKLVVLSALLAVAAAKPSAWPLAHLPLAPVVHALPAAVSHQSRVDIHHSVPVIAAAPLHHALPLAAPLHHAALPLGLGPHTPAIVQTPWGVPLDTADVVAARALHYQAKALAAHGPHHYLRKRSIYAAPLIVAPSAVSHQSRVDVHSTPVLAHLPYAAAPWVSHYAPAPLVSPLSHGLLGNPWAAPAYGIHPW